MSRNTKRNQATKPDNSSACGCSSDSGPVKAVQREEQLHLNDLVPIAVVIAAGCEPCAEKMVRRALEQGASPERIGHVLRIVGSMQKLDCFIQALGTEATARMQKPLAAAERTLQQALAPSSWLGGSLKSGKNITAQQRCSDSGGFGTYYRHGKANSR